MALTPKQSGSFGLKRTARQFIADLFYLVWTSVLPPSPEGVRPRYLGFIPSGKVGLNQLLCPLQTKLWVPRRLCYHISLKKTNLGNPTLSLIQKKLMGLGFSFVPFIPLITGKPEKRSDKRGVQSLIIFWDSVSTVPTLP
jgi:hypothetical protein